MIRKSVTAALITRTLEKRVPLAIAAHYARAQLSSDPRAIYDPQHFIDLLDIAGAAVLRVAPVYTEDAASAAPRRLTHDELEDATVKGAATVVVLRDGRMLSRVSIKRGDLRQAVNVLKALGVPELQRRESVAPRRAAIAQPE